MDISTLTIFAGVAMFTFTVLMLVVVILAARANLVSSGDVAITVNGEKELTVPAGGKLLGTLADASLFLASACGGGGNWNGNWATIVEGTMSVCGCNSCVAQ